MIDANNFDDYLLMLEEQQGQRLASIDDRAVREQNASIQRALNSMAE